MYKQINTYTELVALRGKVKDVSQEGVERARNDEWKGEKWRR